MRRRTAVWAAGVSAAVGAGLVVSRTLVRRSRAGADPEASEALNELPEEDLGPVAGPDRTPLAVRAAGEPSHPSDPTIVFIHGFSLDMTTWHFQWKELSDRYRCVLFDQRGHGRSGPGRDGDYSLEVMGRDIRAVLDAAVPDGPVVLVGHSMGGMAMLAFAETFPEEFGSRVVGAVFADTAAAELVRGAFGAMVARLNALVTLPRADRIRRYLRAGESDLAYLAARLSNFGPDAAPSLVAHVAAVSGRAPVEVWTDALRGILSMDLRDAAAHVRVPSLVVVGDVDRITPPASGRALVEMLPDARLVVLKGAGHVAMMERHEQFNGLLIDFLDDVPARPGDTRASRRVAGGEA